MLAYFHNEGVNSHAPMYDSLVSIAEKVRPPRAEVPRRADLSYPQVNSTFIHRLTELVTTHSLDPAVYLEVREVLLQTCHQFSKVRTVATRHLNDLFANFPSLLCAEEVVTVLLEMLTVLRRACLAEFVDEVSSRAAAPLLPADARADFPPCRHSTRRLSPSTRPAGSSHSSCPTTTPSATRCSVNCTATLAAG